MRDEVVGPGVDPRLIDHAFADKFCAIELADRRVGSDCSVHQRLGETRLVAFIVAEAAVAPHVDDDVAIELLTKLDRQLAAEGHRFRVVAVDVEDRRLNRLGDVRGIGRGARELRRGGEADLIIDHEMERSAGAVAGKTREAETLGDNPLARKRRVTVKQDREDPVAFAVPLDRLHGAGLAQHDRIDRLEVGWVGKQGQMDLEPVELPVRRGAKVIFDVARAADVGRVGGATGEFVEDRPVRLAHDVGEDVQPTAMSHSDGDLLDPQLAAIFDHAFERGDHRFAAIQAKALGADIFAGEEFFPLFAVDDLFEDRLLALGGEVGPLVGAFHSLLEEAPLLEVVDVHIFEADPAAVVGAQDRDDLTNRRGLKTEISADEDRPVEVGIGKAVKFGSEVGGKLALGEAEWIEIGGKVPAHPVGANEHHCANRILGGATNVGLRGTVSGGLTASLLGNLGERRLGRIEPDVHRIERRHRPIRSLPAWSLLGFVQVGHSILMIHGEVRGPGR